MRLLMANSMVAVQLKKNGPKMDVLVDLLAMM